ncbi:putative ABC transport system permease protein [Solimonas aquatica]|uniref:Putative ABC transport system permease protein n=1 Tax=Solimonas aquatica TaxID=489703 RepID=A0A1H9CPF7_9GAMM|nr:ABC transporter permease [Solimonas aquatica]SEQ03085.1 putative ABC transport system permease protein [Solimonas aquatica]
MKYLPLLWASLWRKKLRTLFTALSIIIAFLLFGMLQGVNNAFNRTIELSNVNRLIVISKIALTESLPFSYTQQIESLPGVARVCYQSWFGSYYQDPKNFVFAFPVDPERMFEVYSEFKLPPEQLEAFKHTRSGAVVGADLAREYGWKIGDRVPLHSTIWTRKADGQSDWSFDIVGIYTVPSDRSQENQFFFQHEYFDEARAFARGTVGWFAVLIKDPNQAAAIGAAIDKLFANSQNETKAQTEKEFQMGFLKQIGDIQFIVTRILIAVFVALLFATGSTMTQSVRERIPELAVLKTLGFSDTRVLLLVLAEAVLLCLLSAAAGLALATALFPKLKNMLQVVELPAEVVFAGLGMALLLALAIGLPPAWRAMRLNIVDALAGR